MCTTGKCSGSDGVENGASGYRDVDQVESAIIDNGGRVLAET